MGSTDDNSRIIIAASGHAPPRGSLVLCAPFEIIPTGSIAAIGRVQRQQSAATERVRVHVDPVLLLGQTIDIATLLDNVHASARGLLDDAQYQDQFSPTVFPSHESDLILDALRRTSPEASERLDRLLRVEPDIPEDDMRRLREERDAVDTAFRISGISPDTPLLMPQSAFPRTNLDLNVAFSLSLDQTHILDNEDALIASDLQRFDEHSLSMEIVGSAFRVLGKDLVLTVMNVNRTELEHVHGVDLIYYDHIRDKAVAVQYKRLEWSVSGWVYRNEVDLEEQLRRMAGYPAPIAQTADDWRLSPSPFFFKFVHQDFGRRSSSLLPGMYVPDAYLRLGLNEGRFHTGPRGGFQVHDRSTKYLTSSTFIELIRRCWIGTVRTDRSSLARHAAERAEQCEVILALRDRRVV